MNKKIIWILLLVVFIIVLVLGGIWLSSKNGNLPQSTANAPQKAEGSSPNENSQGENNDYVKIEKSDGVLYAIDGKEVKSDMVIGDNYYDTTITDIYLNPDNYYDKYIEISGMFLSNQNYTFVGRYSTSSLCPYCPAGYSYMEYQLAGKIDKKFKDTDDWIKVIGKLEKGNDETSNYTDYYYLRAVNIEIMKERGNDTVKN